MKIKCETCGKIFTINRKKEDDLYFGYFGLLRNGVLIRCNNCNNTSGLIKAHSNEKEVKGNRNTFRDK